MAFTMYDYLPVATADYSDAVFTVDPQNVMIMQGDKNVKINEGYGVTEERIILSEQSKFNVVLQWTVLSEADHSTIFSFFHDKSKGCAQGRTFLWTPPTQYDSHTYVVRFGSTWESYLRSYQNYGIQNLPLVVLGRVSEGESSIVLDGISATGTSGVIDCSECSSLRVVLTVDSGSGKWDIHLQGCPTSSGTFVNEYMSGVQLKEANITSTRGFVFPCPPKYAKLVATEITNGATISVIATPISKR